MKRTIVLILILISFSASACYGENPDVKLTKGTFSGQIISAKTKEPIEGAKVFFPDSAGEIRYNDGGCFRYDNIKPAKYPIKITAEGYKSFTNDFNIFALRNQFYIIQLDDSNAIDTDTNKKYGSLYGSVIDAKTKEPLHKATVRILGVPIGANVKKNGSFQIIYILIGEYSIKVTFIGHKELQLSGLQIKNNLTPYLEIEMEEEARNTY